MFVQSDPIHRCPFPTGWLIFLEGSPGCFTSFIGQYDQWYASQSPQHYSHNGIVGDTFPYHIVA